MRRTVTKKMLELGVALAWDLVNVKGRVVFRKGFVVNTEQSRTRLLSMQLYVDQDNDADMHDRSCSAAQDCTPVREIDNLADRINETFLGVCKGPQPALSEVIGLVREVRDLCEGYPDACLAVVHFNYTRTYGALHALYTVILSAVLGRALAYSDAQLDTLCCAALTANLGMYEYHDQWSCSDTALSDDQNAIRLQHPQLSIQRLESLGVSDAHWLEVVANHHELIDGSGYPAGLSGDALHQDVQILSIIDRYLAFVMPRAKRSCYHPTHALREIFVQKNTYREQLTGLFIKRIGVYPPGTGVVLKNNEIGVVISSNPDDNTRPRVVSVGPGDGVFYDQPMQRDVGKAEFAIKQVYQPGAGTGGYPALRVTQWV